MTKFCGLYGPLEGNIILLIFTDPISYFCEQDIYFGVLYSTDIESFTYVFPCDFARKNNEVDIYGTGGMILQGMKDLLAFLPGLKRLALIDLELDGFDGMI